MITDIEKRLSTERDVRKGLYKKYKRAYNIIDWLGSFLGVASMGVGAVSIGLPILLPILGTTSLVCVGLATPLAFVRRKLQSKSKKHYEIKTIAESKLNSIKNLVSKSLADGQLTEGEFKVILDEIEKFDTMKGGEEYEEPDAQITRPPPVMNQRRKQTPPINVVQEEYEEPDAQITRPPPVMNQRRKQTPPINVVQEEYEEPDAQITRPPPVMNQRRKQTPPINVVQPTNIPPPVPANVPKRKHSLKSEALDEEEIPVYESVDDVDNNVTKSTRHPPKPTCPLPEIPKQASV
ncbi:hypothetical protein ACF0H5_009325 [Mactra antiquata]